jgi:TolA-binding protein
VPIQIADLLALAVCRSMRNDDKKADQLLTEIDQSYPTAVVRPRAMFMRAIWLIGSRHKNGEEKGLVILAGVWKRYPTSQEGASALCHIGWLAMKSGKPTEVKAALRAYLSQHPQGT